MTEYVQVLTTVGSEKEAERVCATLIESRLAGSEGYLDWISANVRRP